MSQVVVDPSGSLCHAVTRGYLPPVDAAAVACLPDLPDAVRAALEQTVFKHDKPIALARHETPAGSIALIVLPIRARDVYAQRPRLRALAQRALEEAARVGAEVVSLTGLIPSATQLGLDLQSTDARLPAVTTGHATTVSAVVMMLAGGLRSANIDLTRETLACVGVGSIGSAALQLALRVLPRPKRILLCDVFQAKPRLDALAESIEREFGVRVDFTIADRDAVSDTVYGARVIVGATNVPNVLDPRRLRPNSILIDDSAPHCFDAELARARWEASGDILVSEGGLIRSPERLQHRLFLPVAIRDRAASLLTGTLRQQAFAPDQIMGCVLSSALSARLSLPRTLGPVDPAHALVHYEALHKLGFAAPHPQCDAQRFVREPKLVSRDTPNPSRSEDRTHGKATAAEGRFSH
jgi:hypothetical protein